MNFFLKIFQWIVNGSIKATPKAYQLQPIINQPVMEDKITLWAKAIVHWEGHFDGNLKYTTLTKSWGATQGRPALDSGYFCLWKDHDTGFQALCNFLTLGCEGQLIISHPQPCTFHDFTIRFAGNPPLGYMLGIAKEIGCTPETDISTFLVTK